MTLGEIRTGTPLLPVMVSLRAAARHTAILVQIMYQMLRLVYVATIDHATQF